MAVTLNTHSLLTSTTGTSTTGTLTASVGDLAILVCGISVSVPLPAVSGGGLTWIMVIDKTVSVVRGVAFIAPVYSTVTAQTITISDTSSSVLQGGLFAVSNGKRIGANNMLGNLGTNTMTLTTPTGDDGSIVLALFRGATDTVISAGSTQLDSNGADTATASANSSPFLTGTSVAMTATSAGSSLIMGLALEVTSGNPSKFNNYQFVKVGNGMSASERIR